MATVEPGYIRGWWARGEPRGFTTTGWYDTEAQQEMQNAQKQLCEDAEKMSGIKPLGLRLGYDGGLTINYNGQSKPKRKEVDLCLCTKHLWE